MKRISVRMLAVRGASGPTFPHNADPDISTRNASAGPLLTVPRLP